MFSSPFDELEVGARHLSPGRTVTETDVTSFAALTGDHHPQHTDAVWSARSPFGERIAHGMLVLSYAAGLVPIDPERVLALRRVGDAVFKRPVRLGETIRVETRIAATDPATGLVTCHWLVRNQDGRVVARATIELLWRRAATPAASVTRASEEDPFGLVAYAECGEHATVAA